MADAPTLYPDQVSAAGPPERGRHGYYRKIDGWIVTAATSPNNRTSYEYAGHTFLPQYGEFALGTSGGARRESDARGVPWNPADEPWRLIFQRGGAKEFPVDQIIAFRWHAHPPYKEVTFPQLEGTKVYDFQCPECQRGFFSSTVEAEAAEQLKTHLTSQINNRHNYSAADLRSLAQEWGLDFDSRRVGRNVVRQEQGPQVVEPEVPELTPVASTEYDCGECGWSPRPGGKNPRFALSQHSRSHGGVLAETSA